MAEDRTTSQEALRDWQLRRRALVNEGIALVQRWDATFPRGTLLFRLVRLAGESNTLLRWRSSGRAQRTIRGGRFELSDDASLLLELAAPIRASVLDFERRRIQLNYDYAIAAYRVQRLQALDAQHRALAQLRQQHRDALDREIPPAPR